MSKNRTDSLGIFEYVIVFVIVVCLSVLLSTFFTPMIAKANPATPRTTLFRVACNTSNDRYLEVYELNHNGRKFLITKGWTGDSRGGTSTDIIELK
jgi:hypothetical protein